MTPMNNNPMQQIISLLQAGRHPQSVVQLMAQRDPRVRQALQMLNGKTEQEKAAIVANMCAERNTTVEDLARSMGITIPSSR